MLVVLGKKKGEIVKGTTFGSSKLFAFFIFPYQHFHCVFDLLVALELYNNNIGNMDEHNKLPNSTLPPISSFLIDEKVAYKSQQPQLPPLGATHTIPPFFNFPSLEQSHSNLPLLHSSGVKDIIAQQHQTQIPINNNVEGSSSEPFHSLHQTFNTTNSTKRPRSRSKAQKTDELSKISSTVLSNSIQAQNSLTGNQRNNQDGLVDLQTQLSQNMQLQQALNLERQKVQQQLKQKELELQLSLSRTPFMQPHYSSQNINITQYNNTTLSHFQLQQLQQQQLQQLQQQQIQQQLQQQQLQQQFQRQQQLLQQQIQYQLQQQQIQQAQQQARQTQNTQQQHPQLQHVQLQPGFQPHQLASTNVQFDVTPHLSPILSLQQIEQQRVLLENKFLDNQKPSQKKRQPRQKATKKTSNEQQQTELQPNLPETVQPKPSQPKPRARKKIESHPALSVIEAEKVALIASGEPLNVKKRNALAIEFVWKSRGAEVVRNALAKNKQEIQKYFGSKGEKVPAVMTKNPKSVATNQTLTTSISSSNSNGSNVGSSVPANIDTSVTSVTPVKPSSSRSNPNDNNNDNATKITSSTSQFADTPNDSNNTKQ